MKVYLRKGSVASYAIIIEPENPIEAQILPRVLPVIISELGPRLTEMAQDPEIVGLLDTLATIKAARARADSGATDQKLE